MASDVRYIHVADGLEGNYLDMNAARDYMRALEGDMRLGALFHRAAPGAQAEQAFPLRSSCLATGFGGAPYPSAAVALRIQNMAGPIHQYTTTAQPDGATPALLTYWVEADELQTVLSAGHATLPRIDLIELLLDVEDESESRDIQDANGVVTSTSTVVRKRVRCTKNVVAGTPNATPALPATTAGSMAWCYVWVPATHNTMFQWLETWDVRFPMGYDRLFTPAFAMGYYSDAAEWPLRTPTNLYGARLSGAASEVVLAYPPSMDGGKRLLKVHAHADANVDLDLHYRAFSGSASVVLVSSQTNTLELTIPQGTAANSATKPGAVWLTGVSIANVYETARGHYGVQAVGGLSLHITSRAAGTQLFGVSWEVIG